MCTHYLIVSQSRTYGGSYSNFYSKIGRFAAVGDTAINTPVITRNATAATTRMKNPNPTIRSNPSPAKEIFALVRPKLSLGEHRGIAALVAASMALNSLPAAAATISKSDSLTLKNTADWVGGVAPGTSDIALIDSAVSVSNEAALTLGANLSWGGLKIGTVNGPVTITNTGGYSLTLGKSGIDLSAATGNLTINSPLILNGTQAWKAASGRTLTVGGTFTHTGATVDFSNFNSSAVLGGIANDASGILGAWATTGSGTTLNYVQSTSGSVTAYTAQTAATPADLSNVTSASTHYSYGAAATTTASLTANTLRYTGATSTTSLGTGSTLTLNGLMQAGTGALTISGGGTAGGVKIGSTKELVVTGNTQNITIASNILNSDAGASSVTYGGAGTLTLSGSNSYGGGTSVASGTLAITGTSSLGTTAGAVYVANDATLFYNPASYNLIFNTGGAITGSGTIKVSTWLGVTINNTLSGFTGTLNIVKGSSSGKVVLASGLASSGLINVGADTTLAIQGSKTFNNALTLAGGDTQESYGQLRIEYGATYAGNITLTGAVTGAGDFTIGSTGGAAATISGNIGEANGSQFLSKGGVGTIVLNGNNTYSGKTVVGAGTVSFSKGNVSATADQALGKGSNVDLGVASASSGILLYTGAAGTLAKNINALGNGSDTIQNSGSGLLTLSGILTTTNTALTLKGGSNGITVSGQIAGTGANASLIVNSGKVTLTGDSTYAGTTSVNTSGTLAVNGSITGAVNVGSLGTLGGNGGVGALSVQSGGVLTPGNSAGTLTASSATFADGSEFKLELSNDRAGGGTAGVAWDSLAVTGLLDLSSLTSGGLKLTLINLGYSAWDGTVSHTWNSIISFGSGTGLSASAFNLDTAAFEGVGTWSVVQNSNSFDLQYQVVPEPATWAMMIGGLGVLAFGNRLRRRNAN